MVYGSGAGWPVRKRSSSNDARRRAPCVLRLAQDRAELVRRGLPLVRASRRTSRRSTRSSTRTRYGGSKSGSGTPRAREPSRRLRDIEYRLQHAVRSNHCARPSLGKSSVRPSSARLRPSGPPRSVIGDVETGGFMRAPWSAVVAGSRPQSSPRRRDVDGERRLAGRLHAPYRRGRALHRRVGGLRPGVREDGRPRSAAGEGRAQAGRRQRRQDRDRVRGRRDDAGGRRERRAEDDLEGRGLHPRRAHLGQLDRDRPGRDRARARSADRAEQLVARPSPTSRTTATSSAPCPRTRCRRRSSRA